MYILGKEISFPPVEAADENGIVAIGGDLSTERLLLAYLQSLFGRPLRSLAFIQQLAAVAK